MSETPKKLRLDAALAEWPEVERPGMDWEEMASSIDERIRNGETAAKRDGDPSVSDATLLDAPLGHSDADGHNSAAASQKSEIAAKTPRNDAFKGATMTMPADRERDRQSLKDLAKMAGGPLSARTAPPPSVSPVAPPSMSASGVQRAFEAKKDDSGIVDLAMAAQSDPQAATRAQTTPLASQGLFDDEPASIRPGPVSAPAASVPLPMPSGRLSAPPSSQQLQQPMPSLPPPSSIPASLAPAAPLSGPAASAVLAALPANASASASKKKGGGVVFLFGGLLAAAAVAAGGFLFVQHQRAAKLAEPVALSAPAPVVTPQTPQTPVEAKPADTVAPPADPGLDPNALPSTPDPAAAKVAAAKPGAVAVAPAGKPAVAAPAKDDGPKISQKDLPTAPTGPGGDLGAAMKGAVGGSDNAAQTPAAGTNGPQFAAGSVPQKPSQGAVTGAIGSVLPGARACLGPDDAVSRASITFGSAGTVQSVNVTGGAAGKPAEACIKGALGKAKLAPFAEPTYTANITVRH